MPSLLATAFQNTLLKAGANLTAQLASRWRTPPGSIPTPLDLQRIFEFAIFGFIGANVGYAWHHFLEHSFPTWTVTFIAKHSDDDPESLLKYEAPPVPATQNGELKVSWRNIWAKVVVDQTVGLPVMIAIFLVITNVARLATFAMVLDVVKEKEWGLIKAGWTIWPAVCVVNFYWVPVKSRVIVASCVGFGWNIFLSLVSMAR
ncbi:Mpv17/PMP22 family protein [Pseudomassariella vexata]|uniref:Mpv17/PMP22 family protein n=1 Tax=Pseudomassariella vexata TaxID=1141098 RepID=A0A1Y2DAX1_9PEZI|nr:Mpv17/PMP22 family protein [Pseudomassariella vexata]ORY56423.1 Mpv17/PMP22 family protein [Pseudomassariella vexata]